MGYPVDGGMLRVATLANTLKHDTEDLGRKLLDQWSQVFPAEFKEPDRFSDWASSVQLTDQQLGQVFNIVSKSGPTTGLG